MLTYDPHPPEMERLLVYDLGGGTFDVSVAQVENGVVEIQASHGDTQLGGDDFDQLLFDHICDTFAKEHGIDLRQSPAAKARVLRAAEDAKKRLSFDAVTTIEEEFIAEKNGKSLNLVMEITRYDYEELIRPLLLKTLTCLDQALDDAKVQANQIDKVVLVGGATRTPLVHHAAGRTARAPGPLRDRTRPGRRHGGGRPGGPDRRHRRRADPGRHHPAHARHQALGELHGFLSDTPFLADHRAQHAAARQPDRDLLDGRQQSRCRADPDLPGREPGHALQHVGRRVRHRRAGRSPRRQPDPGAARPRLERNSQGDRHRTSHRAGQARRDRQRDGTVPPKPAQRRRRSPRSRLRHGRRTA